MRDGAKEWKIVWSALQQIAQPTQAEPMAAYMRHRFPFLGIKAPARRQLVRSLDLKLPDLATLIALVRRCFEGPAREAHYVGLDLLENHQPLWTPQVLDLLEDVTITQSWWDTADRISSPLMWKALNRFPDENERPDRWVASRNLWLRRAALLYQRTARTATDTERLSRYIEASQDSSEFFLQKAIGWALRQYGYTDPNWVEAFVSQHPTLSALSRREALRAL